MTSDMPLSNPATHRSAVESRASWLHEESYHQLAARNDRLFAWLLTFEWVIGIVLALWLTPRTWSGTQSALHIHVYAAVFLGAAAISLPLLLVQYAPRTALTRNAIAAAQMVICGLLIDLTGGRIETHFLIFGSLAFLAFYQDGRVLVTASAITLADHFLRGIALPRSIYGVDIVSSWRWLEHSGYVLLEDLFLISSCHFGVRERRARSKKQAELEFAESELQGTRDGLERRVEARTAELIALNDMLSQEIAARKANEQALKAALDAAEQATRAKSEFLANMSHEIRTPATAMVGFADLMLDPGQSLIDRHQGLRTIRRNAKHLLGLINDILDISKIEAGHMTVERTESDMTCILAEVMSLMRPRAIEKKLELELAFDSRVPRQIVTDALRLKQILVNLLSNAIKFTSSGRIELRVEVKAAESGHDVIFRVIDTGIGMRQEQMREIFRPFAQADGSMTRKYGGTGLGLTISLRLAQLLGGELSVVSVPGAGSTFTASVHSEIVEPAQWVEGLEARTCLDPQPCVQFEQIRGRLLLVEDGKDNQLFISAMLRAAGADVTIADNGRIAVELAQSRSFDLIFMDMQMPEMDGYEAASFLRGKGFTLPIVAITAHAMSDDRQKCIRAGCTDYLTKPLDRATLIRTANSYLPKALASGAPRAHRPMEGNAGTSVSPRDTSPGRLVSTRCDDPVIAGILPKFIARLPGKVLDIRKWLDAGEMDRLAREIHQLKGAGGSYGFPAITDAARIAEESVRSGAPMGKIGAEVAALVALIQSVDGYDRPEARIAA